MKQTPDAVMRRAQDGSGPPSTPVNGADRERHYLREELYELVRKDPAIFDFLQAGSLDGIWYWDVTDPAEEWMSPRFKELFGYSDDEIPNDATWWQENIHPDDLQVALDNFAAHLEDPDHPYDQVVRYRHRDGSTVWVRCRGIAVRDEDGNPLRLLGAHTDVTDFMAAKEALERSEQRWRKALESAPIGLALVAPDGRWLEVNASLCRLLGYEREELLEMDFQRVTHHEDLEGDLELVDDVLQGKRETYQLEKRYIHKSGRIVPIMLSVALVRDAEGEPVHFIAQIEDIGERKRNEENLRRSNRELSEFAYVASHDLRAPMRQLNMSVELLERRLDDEQLDAETRRLLEVLGETTGRMNRLIDDLLAVARVRDDKPFVPVELAGVVAETIATLEPRLQETGGRIEVADELPVVPGDRSQLLQLFQNLFENALLYKHPDRDPRVTVEVGHVGGRWQLTVADNGIGIEPENATRIFEMFKRLGTGPAEGTGIGLALVARIAEHHGGHASLDLTRTQPGVGSAFRVLLRTGKGE